MNQKIIQLLSYLRNNSREKLTTISKKTNIPISTLFDMLNEMQGTIIKNNTILLNYEILGYHTRAHVFLKVSNNDKEKLKEHLICNNNVNSIYKINNGWDFIVETVHKSIKELDQFLENVNNNHAIEKKEIHYLIEDVKREGFIVD